MKTGRREIIKNYIGAKCVWSYTFLICLVLAGFNFVAAALIGQRVIVSSWLDMLVGYYLIFFALLSVAFSGAKAFNRALIVEDVLQRIKNASFGGICFVTLAAIFERHF